MSYLIGQSLGRYHILEQLGEGGMAIVYKAYDTRLETDVAVKVIRTENILPSVLERALKRFEREAKSLARLTHPNIVKVTDYGEYEGKPYLVMPYLPGGTLKSKLSDKPMPWQEAARILIPIADALGYAHEHDIIHRDVKPSNILITENGQPMLADFGVAKLLDAVETMELTGTGVGIGTPEYMAPEQVTNKLVDARADIYALGVVLFEMVTGRKPYIADTPMAVLIMHSRDPLPRPRGFAPNLPQEVENILLKALAKEPKDRYATAAQFAKALDEAVATLGVDRGKAWPPKLAGMARRPWRIAVALVGMAVVAGVIVFALRGSLSLGGVVSAPSARSAAGTSAPVKATIPDKFIYDDFNGEGSLSPTLWNNGCGESATQVNGVLTLGVEQLMGSCSVIPAKLSNISIRELGAFETQLRISNDFHGTGEAWASLLFRSSDAPGGGDWWAECGLMASPDDVQVNYNIQNSGQHKTDSSSSLPAAFDTWYTVRLETDPQTMAFSCYVDGKLIKTVIPSDAEALRSAHFQREIQSWRGTGAKDDPSAAQATTYVDNVRIFPGGTDLSAIRNQPTPLPSDPTLYDDFSNPAYDGQINTALWTIDAKTPDTILQQNGMLSLRNSGGPMRGAGAVALKYGWFTLSQPIFFQADVMMDSADHAGVIFIYFRNDPGGSGPFQEVQCGIDSQAGADHGQVNCWDRWNKWPTETWEDEYSAPISPTTKLGVWHTVRIAIDPATLTLTYTIDGQEAGSHTPVRAEDLKGSRFMFAIGTHAPTANGIIGYVDNVRVGTFTSTPDKTSTPTATGIAPDARLLGPCDKTDTSKLRICSISLFDSSIVTLLYENPDLKITTTDGFSGSWSPDGTQIVFAAEPANTPSTSMRFLIYIVNVDGTNFRQLPVQAMSWEPSWSPDGQWIAFDHDGYLMLIHPDGSGLKTLLQDRERCFGPPQWSPDSRSVVAPVGQGACTSDGKQPYEAWIISVADGSHTVLTPMFPWCSNDAPFNLRLATAFSPDGQHIAYIDTSCLPRVININNATAQPPEAGFPLWWSSVVYPQWGGLKK